MRSRGLLILTYHTVSHPEDFKWPNKSQYYNVSPINFENQMRFLRSEGFSVCQLEELFSSSPKENKFLITFDDSTDDHYYTVLPILEKYGYKGIFFVITSKINKQGYLSESQLKEMVELGHIIGSHSHSHTYLLHLDNLRIREELESSKKVLETAICDDVVFFAPPGGGYNKRVKRICREVGYKAVRTSEWGYNKKLSLFDLQHIPITSLMTDNDFVAKLNGNMSRTLYLAKETAKRILGLKLCHKIRMWGFNHKPKASVNEVNRKIKNIKSRSVK